MSFIIPNANAHAFSSFEYEYEIVHERTPSKDYTSHSALSEIKRVILDLPEFSDEYFFKFGRKLHAKDLEKKTINVKLKPEDEVHIKKMCQALDNDSFWQKLKRGAKIEHRKFAIINKCKVKCILDVWRGTQHVADLKSTSCETEEDFIKKAIEYDYFRQGVTYKLATGAKNVYFVGILKREPYTVYVLRIEDYPELMKQAMYELAFLLWYYKKHGYPKRREIKIQRHDRTPKISQEARGARRLLANAALRKRNRINQRRGKR